MKLAVKRLQAERDFELVPEERLYLTDAGFYVGNIAATCETPNRVLKKFIVNFQQVWNTVPLSARTGLLCHWRTHRNAGDQLSRVVILRTSGLQNEDGACANGGRELWFNTGAILFMGSKRLRSLIARMLATSLCWIDNWRTEHICETGSCMACELRAYSYMAAWGHDPFEGVLSRRKDRTLLQRIKLQKSNFPLYTAQPEKFLAGPRPR